MCSSSSTAPRAPPGASTPGCGASPTAACPSSCSTPPSPWIPLRPSSRHGSASSSWPATTRGPPRSPCTTGSATPAPPRAGPRSTPSRRSRTPTGIPPTPSPPPPRSSAARRSSSTPPAASSYPRAPCPPRMRGPPSPRGSPGTSTRVPSASAAPWSAPASTRGWSRPAGWWWRCPGPCPRRWTPWPAPCPSSRSRSVTGCRCGAWSTSARPAGASRCSASCWRRGTRPAPGSCAAPSSWAGASRAGTWGSASSRARTRTPSAAATRLIEALAAEGLDVGVVEQGDGWAAWITFDLEPDVPAAQEAARAVRRAQQRWDDDLPSAVGVGRVHHGPAGIARSLTEAADAARLAASRPQSGRFLHVDRLGLAQLLLAWTQTDTFQPAALELLAPLRPLTAGDLLATLATYLDAESSVAETASILAVHRNTVAERIQRVQRILQVDLADAETRLALHLACRTVLAAEG
ncbi:helix-turn-helix domain-containing protein [Clavibacter tessellarius]|uniref:PucR family transcriptional regulator n=1 Tax=Clavibacter tessellarius TaxID=31965 RepID=UPI00324D0510